MSDDYKVLQIRTNVKETLKIIADEKGVSQSGLIAAIIYTLEGRQDHGKIKLDWKSIREEYPAPMQVDRKSWRESTDKLCKTLDKYSDIHILDAAEEAKVDVRMIWTILCFMYDKGRLSDHDEDDEWLMFEDETTVILHEEGRALFDKAWNTFADRKQKRKEKRKNG